MSFNDYENSPSSGRPIYLFMFRYGDDVGAKIALTDATVPVTVGGETYEPAAIEADDMLTDSSMGQREYSVTCSKNNPVAQRMAGYPNSYVISLVIRQGHLENDGDDPAWSGAGNFPVVWTGTVIERVSDSSGKVKLTCAEAGSSMKSPGLTRYWQLGCPLALYSDECGADIGAATVTAEVVALSANSISITPGWGKAGTTPSNYIGGRVSWAGPEGAEYRMILRAEAGQIFLNGKIIDLEVAGTISISLGCPRTSVACAGLHNNIVNFGGFTDIPSENPVRKNTHD